VASPPSLVLGLCFTNYDDLPMRCLLLFSMFEPALTRPEVDVTKGYGQDASEPYEIRKDFMQYLQLGEALLGIKRIHS